ncbi:MAG TPA: hypothetical protein VGR25_00335 [bacterium]|jgi:hypothetical protein|nr:hypothetical protein [bacterium]
MISRAISLLGGILLFGAMAVLFYGGRTLSRDIARISQQTDALREQVTVLNRRVQTLNEILYAFRPPGAELPQAQRSALQAEAERILAEAKVRSWAYYKEHGFFPRRADDIVLSVPAGSAWTPPIVVAGGGPKERTIRWVVTGNGTRIVTARDQCYLVLARDGTARQGCNF